MQCSDIVKCVISNAMDSVLQQWRITMTLRYIQSVVLSEGVPNIILEIEQSLNFKTFHMGIKVPVPLIVENKIRV